MASRFSVYLVQAWYQGALWLYLFWPFSFLYYLIIQLRRYSYHLGLAKVYRSPLPVIVVGNITLGGTGKSPMVMYLVNALREKGFNPGVISRGYGGSVPSEECVEVTSDSDAQLVGDEPLMLKKRLGCSVVVSSNRRLAIQRLESLGCDIVISDDGMQHYAMARDVEICLFDGQRKMGNRMVLPTGPLREPASRLNRVDFVVVNGGEWQPEVGIKSYRMQLSPQSLIPVSVATSLSDLDQSKKIHAVAAIGHPDRFFEALKKLGWTLESHPFDDHHAFQKSDFDFAKGQPVVMTEKDAVKCADLALENAWFLPVEARLNGPLIEDVLSLLKHKGYLNG